MKAFIVLTVLNILVLAYTFYTVRTPDRELEQAYIMGAKSGSIGTCWHLTYLGNERCQELADKLN